MNKIEYTNPSFQRIKSQLGAPSIDIELTNEQMADLLESAHNAFYLLYELDKVERTKYFKDFWVEQYFFALCKEALGRVRGKFDGKLPVPGTELKLNHKELLVEADKEKQFLRYLMLKDKNILIENQKPILAFYINVRNMNGEDVSTLVEQIKAEFHSDNLIQYFVPIRDGESRIECVYPKYIASDEVKKEIEESTSCFNNRIKNFEGNEE